MTPEEEAELRKSLDGIIRHNPNDYYGIIGLKKDEHSGVRKAIQAINRKLIKFNNEFIKPKLKQHEKGLLSKKEQKLFDEDYKLHQSVYSIMKPVNKALYGINARSKYDKELKGQGKKLKKKEEARDRRKKIIKEGGVSLKKRLEEKKRLMMEEITEPLEEILECNKGEYYKILGLKRKATMEEVDGAVKKRTSELGKFWKKVLEGAPSPADKKLYDRAVKALNSALFLMDPGKKSEHDKKIDKAAKARAKIYRKKNLARLRKLRKLAKNNIFEYFQKVTKPFGEQIEFVRPECVKSIDGKLKEYMGIDEKDIETRSDVLLGIDKLITTALENRRLMSIYREGINSLQKHIVDLKTTCKKENKANEVKKTQKNRMKI